MVSAVEAQEYFVEAAGHRVGPFSVDQVRHMLRTGKLAPGSSLSSGGAVLQATDYPEFGDTPLDLGPQRLQRVLEPRFVLVALAGLGLCLALHLAPLLEIGRRDGPVPPVLELPTAGQTTAGQETAGQETAVQPGGGVGGGAFDNAWTSAVAVDPMVVFRSERTARMTRSAGLSLVLLTLALWMRTALLRLQREGRPLPYPTHQVYWMWLVPIFNFYRPIQFMARIAAASAPGRAGWAMPMAVAWWVAFLLASGIGSLSGRAITTGAEALARDPGMWSAIEEGVRWAAVADGLHVLSGILLGWIVVKVSHWDPPSAARRRV